MHKARSHHPKPSKRNSSFYPLIIFALVVATGLVVFKNQFNRQRSATPLAINVVGTDSGVVDLTLTPTTSQVEPGTELLLTLTAKPGNYLVGDITVELTYDESKVGTPVLTQGTYLTDKIGTPTVSAGKINFEYVAPTSGLAMGDGVVATIKLFPTGSGTTTLSFTDKTEVVVVDPSSGATIPSNMLKSVINAVITIGSSQVSPSPSPSASITPNRPPKPTGLRSNCFDGGNKITLRWDPVAGVDSYKLRLDQKDGTADKSIDGIKVTEGETTIIPDQKYSWWVHSSKDGVDSEEARIDEVICVKSTNPTPTPTPTPTATPKTSVKPTTKPTTKPTAAPSASVKPSTSAHASIIPFVSSPSTGSLNDIFSDKDALTSTPKPSSKPSFFKQITLGWQSILAELAKIFN